VINDQFEFGESVTICDIYPKNKALIGVEKDRVIFQGDKLVCPSVMAFSKRFVGALNSVLESYFYDEKLTVRMNEQLYTDSSLEGPDHGLNIFVAGSSVPETVVSKICHCARYYCQEIISQSELGGAEKVDSPETFLEILADEIKKYRTDMADKNIKVPFYIKFEDGRRDYDYVYQGRYDEGVVAEQKTMDLSGFSRPIGLNMDTNVVVLQPVDEDNMALNKQIEFKVKSGSHMREVIAALYHCRILAFRGIRTTSRSKRENPHVLQDIKMTDKSNDLF